MVRHSNQATNPESLTPNTSATAERCPSAASFPKASNENACFGSCRSDAIRFFAKQAACRVACCAVGGHGCQVLWSTTHAQSPTAQTPRQSTTSRSLLTQICHFSFLHGSYATRGFSA